MELQSLRRSLLKLLPLLPPRGEDWKPRENMRSIWELAVHMVQIAAVDTLIATEATQAQVRALEHDLQAVTPEGLLAVYDRGVEAARGHFGSMSAADFDAKTATPCRQRNGSWRSSPTPTITARCSIRISSSWGARWTCRTCTREDPPSGGMREPRRALRNRDPLLQHGCRGRHQLRHHDGAACRSSAR
jgi:hypothetical protein